MSGFIDKHPSVCYTKSISRELRRSPRISKAERTYPYDLAVGKAFFMA